MNTHSYISRNTSFWLVFFIFSGLFVLILAGMGLRDPWPPDEPRFALMAKEMVDTGNWFFPHRGGEIYPDKPPLLMWLVAFLYWLTGNLKISFLLPSAFASLITLILIWDLSRRLWDKKIAIYTLLLLGTTAQFMLLAKSGQLDAMVSMWVMVGCYGFLRHIILGPNWFWYFLSWFAMGLGVITKGVGFLPVFLLLPLLIYKVNWGVEEKFSLIKWLIGPVFMLAAIATWLLPMLWQVELHSNQELVNYKDNILLKQTAERYAKSWGHIKPFWFYITSVIPVFWMPLSLISIWLIKPWFMHIKNKDYRIIFPLFWVIAVIVFFSISKGKRHVYLLPALPMLALSISPFIHDILKNQRFKIISFSILVLLSILLTVIGASGLLDHEKLLALSIKYGADPWLPLLVMGLSCLVTCILSRRKLIVCYLISFSIVTLLTSFWIYPILDKARNTSHMIKAIAKVIPIDAELGIIDFREKLLLHSLWPTTHFGYHTSTQDQYMSAKLWLSNSKKKYVLINDNSINNCIKISSKIKYDSIQNNFWFLYSYDALQACNFKSEKTILGFTK